MGISAIYGLPGRGKSLFSSYYGFHLAEKYQKQLVSNFLFNPVRLAYYCKLMNYTWLLSNIEKGIIHYISATTDLEKILSIKDSIVLLDEAGIYLPSRGSTHNTPKQLLIDLCQVRHDSQYLIYAAQSDKQVDVAIRNLTEEVFYCNGISAWCPKMRNQKLIYKTTHRFTIENFDQWFGDPKLRKNPLKTKLLANKSWSGPLTAADKFLFSIYDSFNRLESQSLKQTESKAHLLAYKKTQNQELVFPPPPKTDKVEFPKIEGHCPFKLHKYSKFTSSLFNLLPAVALDKVIRIDRRLSKVSSFTKLEFLIIKVILGVLLFPLVGVVLP